MLIILNAATTVTANNQFNNHDQNLGGGQVDTFCLSSKTTGGAHAPPVPYTPPAHAWRSPPSLQANRRRDSTRQRGVHNCILEAHSRRQ